MIEIIHQYTTLRSMLKQLIDVSGYKDSYIAKKMHMPPANFATKKKRNNWNDEEVTQLISVIQNEDTEELLLRKIMEERLQEGEDATISHTAFMKEMGWK